MSKKDKKSKTKRRKPEHKLLRKSTENKTSIEYQDKNFFVFYFLWPFKSIKNFIKFALAVIAIIGLCYPRYEIIPLDKNFGTNNVFYFKIKNNGYVPLIVKYNFVFINADFVCRLGTLKIRKNTKQAWLPPIQNEVTNKISSNSADTIKLDLNIIKQTKNDKDEIIELKSIENVDFYIDFKYNIWPFPVPTFHSKPRFSILKTKNGYTWTEVTKPLP